MDLTLEIKDLNKSYKDFNLKGISFGLPKGYIMGLIGPNGSGKTTIIKSIMNLINKDSGTIQIFGKDHQKEEMAIKQKIGFVYDTPVYYEHLTLNQFKNTIAPFYSNWDEKRFRFLAKRLELPLNKRLKKYSKGMAMKSAIAIALSHNAEFIVMDEPTSGLDPIVRREILEFLRDLIQDENKSVLFSSHITTDIEQIGDYITYINKGQLVFTETKDDVFEKHAIVKGGKELINEGNKDHFVGIKMGEYGFEALTKDITATKALFDQELLYDSASLEDIMFYSQQNKG